MTAFRIIALCLSAAMICVSLRTSQPQIASAIALAAGVGTLLISLQDIGEVAGTLKKLEALASEGGCAYGSMMKICGIALVAEFASDICRDCGESALATKTELAGKIVILAVAMPMITSIAQISIELIN